MHGGASRGMEGQGKAGKGRGLGGKGRWEVVINMQKALLLGLCPGPV